MATIDHTVRAQYEAHPYPARDPKDEAKRLVEGSPSHLLELRHYLFAGGRTMPKKLRVLVAGGGTGDGTIMLAQHLKDANWPAELVYLDLSEASRAIATARAAARGLDTIRFVGGAIADLATLAPGAYDYIDCCGVLHHLADPAGALAILTAQLAPGGGMGIMVYGELGRSGVYDTQAMLRAIGGELPVAQRLDLARRLLKQLPATNRFRRNPAIADHLAGGDAGLQDLLLHARDRAFLLPELIELVSGVGLEIAALIEPWRYQPERYLNDPALLKQLAPLPWLARAAFAEQLAGNIKTHIAYLVRAGESADRIASPDDRSLIPVLKGFDGPALARSLKPGAGISVQVDGLTLKLPLPPRAGPILALVDGKRSIGEIVIGVAQGNDVARVEADFRATYETFNALNRLFLKAPGF
ncbi:MAG: class I SAM-dependent methyltransferase [Dongiaceae bacterium]